MGNKTMIDRYVVEELGMIFAIDIGNSSHPNSVKGKGNMRKELKNNNVISKFQSLKTKLHSKFLKQLFNNEVKYKKERVFKRD